jgi:hypothetical protein
LNDKKVVPAYVFIKFDKGLTVGERGYRRLAQWDFDKIRNPLGELAVGISGEDLKAVAENRSHVFL